MATTTAHAATPVQTPGAHIEAIERVVAVPPMPSAAWLRSIIDHVLVVDTRSTEAFRAGHIEGPSRSPSLARRPTTRRGRHSRRTHGPSRSSWVRQASVPTIRSC